MNFSSVCIWVFLPKENTKNMRLSRIKKTSTQPHIQEIIDFNKKYCAKILSATFLHHNQTACPVLFHPLNMKD